MSKLNELYYILNEKNKPITKEYVQDTLKKYGIKPKIKKIDYYQEAMVHVSYLIRDESFYKSNKTKLYQIQSTEIEPIKDLNIAMPLHQKSYERLEFLGDAVIHNTIASYFFNRYPDEDDGFMTKLRTKIENGDTLSILAKSIGLDEYMVISRNVELNEAREKNQHILEDIFEAFIGALFLDTDFETCNRFIVSLLEEKIDLARVLQKETNFKEKLSQYCHTRRMADPIYGQLDVSGPENKKMYTMYVKCRKNINDEGTTAAIGTGSSKKQAEQECARLALIKFGVYKEESDDEVEYEVLSDEIDEYEVLSDNE